MDGFFVLLGLALLLGLILGPIAFFMGLGTRERLREALDRIAQLESSLRRFESRPRTISEYFEHAAPAPEGAAEPEEAKTEPENSETTETPIGEGAQPVAAQDESPPPPPPAQPVDQTPPPAPAPPRGLEETLGARWTVWVGGLALALGALLLVQYSIQQGYFGPGVRIIMGLVLAVALIVAGEWMRRKERDAAPDAQPTGVPSIPAMLTAAGAVAAFGAIYSAYALYEFIGPAIAFVALGATGVACMFAAALHGPTLAALGLVGSLGTPLLVSTNNPNPWALTLYLAIVSAASYGLARLRRWLWLAVCTALGGGFWTLGYIASIHGELATSFFQAGALHVLLAMALAIWFLAIDPWRGADPQTTPADAAAIGVPSGFALLAHLLMFDGAVHGQYGAGWLLFAALIAVILAGAGFVSVAAAALAGVAGLFIAATLRSWPGTFATDIAWRLPDWSLVHWVEPVDPGYYVAFGLVFSLGLMGVCALRLLAPGRMNTANACLFSATATLTPLLSLTIAWLRFGKFEQHNTSAAMAAALGVVFVFMTQVFRQRVGDQPAAERLPAHALGLGAFAAATIASLSLALVFALSGGTLTVALALSALGSAYVAHRLEIPALRWCVAALGVAVAARLAWDPRIVGAALGKTPVFNWLLVGYGVPALAFWLSARLMRRPDGVEDFPQQVAQLLAVLLSGFLVLFEIRHALHDGDIYARASDFVEVGMIAFSGFAFGAALARLNAAHASIVYRVAGILAGAGSMIVAALGLGFGVNPLFHVQEIVGGPFIDTLLIGYALPALAAYVLARLSIGVRPAWYVGAARIVTIGLVFAWITLETRHLFQGDYIYLSKGASDAEWYSYSAIWLAFGLLLLGYGLWRGAVEARIASAFFVLLTVGKVFLFDLAGLTGIWRPLSFIGLGLVLLGIGFVYQKFVFARPRAPSADETPPVV